MILLYLSLGADTYGFLNISFQCFIHYSLSIRSHRTISAGSCSSVINLKRTLSIITKSHLLKRWCAYDPSALYCMFCRRQTKHHPMYVSVGGIGILTDGSKVWTFYTDRSTPKLSRASHNYDTIWAGKISVTEYTRCLVHIRFRRNARIHTVIIYRRWMLPRFSLSSQLIIIANKEILDSSRVRL